MEKLCIKDFKKDNIWFIAGGSYEFSFDPYNRGFILVTDARGMTIDLSINTFLKHFI